MNSKTKRLTKDDEKTKNSIQKNLSPEEIKEKLEEYKRVENVETLALNAHLRYFNTDKNGNKNFRLGGFLTKIDKDKGYMILSNGNVSWSVQIKDSIFFQKMNFKDLKEELTRNIEEGFKKEIKDLKKENKKLKDTIIEIKNEVKKKSK
tara:strand:+ start:3619 stop:4065 length:447 start_codon:yes stop_codon:yes gene_type:complete